jgi:PAN domain
VIPNWYKPLPPGHLEDIRRQAEACPSTGITEKEAISRLSGKAEALGAERLAAKRSDSGKDQPLPRAPIPSADVVVPPPSGMGALIEGRAYLLAEYRIAKVASAAECSALCAHEERCAAMSFYVDQKLCSLKDRVSTFTDHGNVISAVKLRRR